MHIHQSAVHTVRIQEQKLCYCSHSNHCKAIYIISSFNFRAPTSNYRQFYFINYIFHIRLSPTNQNLALIKIQSNYKQTKKRLTFTERNSLMSGRNTISSLSHTCLELISILPRSFHRCLPYLIKSCTQTQHWNEIMQMCSFLNWIFDCVETVHGTWFHCPQLRENMSLM